MAAVDESLRQHRARLKTEQQGNARPLIENVNNRWMNEEAEYTHSTDQDDTHELAFCDLDNPRSCPNKIIALCTSRRFRIMVLYVVLALVIACFLWSRYLQPRLQDEWAYREGFISQENGTYGIAKGGDLDADFVRMKHLDRKLLPGGPYDPDGKRRLVFIGDVHGCKKELLKLLDQVDFNEKTDHLILTGDVISKGPDNVGVLDELIRLNATSVRGNHEDRILHVAKSLDQDPPPTSATSSKGVAKDFAILQQLNKHHLKYLRDMPLMFHVAALPQALTSTTKAHSPISEDILVVHAGIVPDVPLDKQDPYFVMNMRSINHRTHVPSAMRESKDSKPWFDLWNWYNDRIFRKNASLMANLGGAMSAGWLDTFARAVVRTRKAQQLRPQQVVYGHDSKIGLQLKRWSKGLDSGCVNGKELTAMVLDAKGRFELHSVGCKKD